MRSRDQGEHRIQSYLDRWACEEGYRSTKQGLQLEEGAGPAPGHATEPGGLGEFGLGTAGRLVRASRYIDDQGPTAKAEEGLALPLLQPVGGVTKAVCGSQDGLSWWVASQEDSATAQWGTYSGLVRRSIPSSSLTVPGWGVKNGETPVPPCLTNSSLANENVANVHSIS